MGYCTPFRGSRLTGCICDLLSLGLFIEGGKKIHILLCLGYNLCRARTTRNKQRCVPLLCALLCFSFFCFGEGKREYVQSQRLSNLVARPPPAAAAAAGRANSWLLLLLRPDNGWSLPGHAPAPARQRATPPQLQLSPTNNPSEFLHQRPNRQYRSLSSAFSPRIRAHVESQYQLQLRHTIQKHGGVGGARPA